MKRQDVTRYAVAGARARLAELDRERAEIIDFLRDAKAHAPTARQTAPAGREATNGSRPVEPAKRSHFTEAARKKAAARMRKLWKDKREVMLRGVRRGMKNAAKATRAKRSTNTKAERARIADAKRQIEHARAVLGKTTEPAPNSD